MSWRDWFSIESWFFTTAAAQGLRDARHDYPREDTYVEATALVQPVINSTRLAPDTSPGTKSAPAVVIKLAPYEYEELKIAESRIDRICEAAIERQSGARMQRMMAHRYRNILNELERRSDGEKVLHDFQALGPVPAL